MQQLTAAKEHTTNKTAINFL